MPKYVETTSERVKPAAAESQRVFEKDCDQAHMVELREPKAECKEET